MNNDRILVCERCGYQWLNEHPQHADHDCVEYLRGLFYDAVEHNRRDRWWFEIGVDLSTVVVDEHGFQSFSVRIYDSQNRSGFPNKTVRVTALGADEAKKLVQHKLFSLIGNMPDDIIRGSSQISSSTVD